MRIIPKKIKVRQTVWKCYSMIDILIALIVFIFVFIALTSKNLVIAILLGLLMIILFMPVQEGIFYTSLFENVKFLLSKKKFTSTADKEKENINTLFPLKTIQENGVLEYRGGYYGRVIKIGQKNFGMEDIDQQNLDIQTFANALKRLEGTQCADIVKIDRPVNLDTFSQGLFDKVSANKASLENEHIKKIKNQILKERIDQIDKMNHVKKQYISDYYIVIYSKNELDLEQLSLGILSDIAKIGLSTKFLDKKEVAVFLKYSFSRNFDEREINQLAEEKWLDWIKPKEVFFRSNKFTISKVTSSILTVNDYPLRVKNGWGVDLFNIPNTKVVMHLTPVDKYKAIKRIDKAIDDMETKQIFSQKASESSSAEIHRETMGVLLEHLQTENENLLDVNLMIQAYNYDENENYKKMVRRGMMVGNFKPSTLYGLQIEAFKTSCISPYTSLNQFARGINSSSLSAVFPFVKTFVMDDGGILLGENRSNHSPFMLDLWKRGSLYQNSNAIIIGKSGSGKSFFLKNLILNEWVNGTRIIILDPEAEYLMLTKNLYGNRIDVGNALEGRINPFHVYTILTEDGKKAKAPVVFHAHLKMLESFFKIVLEGVSSDVVELINNLVLETYESKGITEQTDCTDFRADRFPIFSDLLQTLLAKNKENIDVLTLRDMRTAEVYLQKFVKGRYSDIWNGCSTLEVNSNLINFNFQSLFVNKQNSVLANAQMLLIFRFIEQEVINAREANKKGRNLKTMIVTDEAHLFIDAKFPIALDFFYSMSKRIRKYNGSFIPATQSIADWNATEELRNKTSAILKNSQYNFIFKLSAPDIKDLLDVYKAGDSFNEDEQKMILSSATGQAFFIGSTELRSCVNIVAGDLAKSLFEETSEKKEMRINEETT